MRPEFKEAVKIAATGEYKCIPVSLEIYADQYTSLMVLKCKQTLLHAGISGG